MCQRAGRRSGARRHRNVGWSHSREVKDDVLARRRLEAGFCREALATVLFAPNYFYTRVRTSNALKHIAAGVGRCIVNDDDFDIRVGLRKNRSRRFSQELGVAVEPLRSPLGVPGENNAGLLGYLRSIARNN